MHTPTHHAKDLRFLSNNYRLLIQNSDAPECLEVCVGLQLSNGIAMLGSGNLVMRAPPPTPIQDHHPAQN